MSRRLIAIIDWQSSALLKENVRLLRHAVENGKVRPREGKDGSVRYRSLALWEDGTCELQRSSKAAVARRLGWSIVSKAARKVRMVERG